MYPCCQSCWGAICWELGETMQCELNKSVTTVWRFLFLFQVMKATTARIRHSNVIPLAAAAFAHAAAAEETTTEDHYDSKDYWQSHECIRVILIQPVVVDYWKIEKAFAQTTNFLVSCQTHVSALAPIFRPRILDNPKLQSGLFVCSISDKYYAMVARSLAFAVIVNSLGVVKHIFGSRADIDYNWPKLAHCSL